MLRHHTRLVLLLSALALVAAGRDHYEVLGVDKTADDGAIKKAYRKLSRTLHPGKSPNGRFRARSRRRR